MNICTTRELNSCTFSECINISTLVSKEMEREPLESSKALIGFR